MTELALPLSRASQRRVNAGHRVLDVVLPVYNEVTDLPDAVRRVHRFLATAVPYPVRIVIADNASTDGTLEVARRLADELPGIGVSIWIRRGAAARCGPRGWRRTPTSLPTWTSTCPPICRR